MSPRLLAGRLSFRCTDRRHQKKRWKIRVPTAKEPPTTPTAILAFPAAVRPEDPAGMGVEVESPLAGVEDAILAAAGAEVSQLRLVVAAGTEFIVSVMAATNLAFESANLIALVEFGCCLWRNMTAISDVCGVRLDGQSSCPLHCQTFCWWQGNLFMDVLRCSIDVIHSSLLSTILCCRWIDRTGSTTTYLLGTTVHMRLKPNLCQYTSLG